MSNPSREPERWSNCPPGAIARSTSQFASRRRRRDARRIAAVLTVLLAVPLAAWSVGVLGGRPAAAREKLTCRDVHDLSRDYLAGGLDGPIRRLFDAHLDRCPKCREWVHKQAAAPRAPAAARSRPTTAVSFAPRPPASLPSTRTILARAE